MPLFAEDFGPYAPSEDSTSDHQRAVADSLLAQLLAELTAAWERGERLRAEDLLTRHPQLWERPEAAVRLIYEEICLREDHGEHVSPSEVIRRFPSWKSELEVLCACHGLFQSITSPPTFPEPGEMLGEFLLES